MIGAVMKDFRRESASRLPQYLERLKERDLSIAVTAAPEASVLRPVTFVPSRKLIPCFSRMRWNVFATSRSMPGTMRSRWMDTSSSGSSTSVSG